MLQPTAAKRTKLIGCPVVIDELRAYLPAEWETETLDAGLHVRPEGLREALQAAIDASAGKFDTIILGYGLCSGAVVGLKANGCTLVVPRVDDCIGLFLGSQSAYREQTRAEPGTYYLTRGWIDARITVFSDHERTVERWGQERADRLMRLMLKNYRRLAFIRTGRPEAQEPGRAYAQEAAARFQLRFEELEGTSALLEKLAAGPWEGEFVRVSPGDMVRQEAFWGDQPACQEDETLSRKETPCPAL